MAVFLFPGNIVETDERKQESGSHGRVSNIFRRMLFAEINKNHEVSIIKSMLVNYAKIIIS